MRIQFTHDFQGKLTGPYFYPAGTEVDLEDEIALRLIALDHAVAVDSPAEPDTVIEPEPEPVKRPIKSGKKGDGDEQPA